MSKHKKINFVEVSVDLEETAKKLLSHWKDIDHPEMYMRLYRPLIPMLKINLELPDLTLRFHGDFSRQDKELILTLIEYYQTNKNKSSFEWVWDMSRL